MTTICLHIGQCGVQLMPETDAKYSQTGLKHLLVDSESKTLERFAQRPPQNNISTLRLDTAGCGNNWAFGYSHRNADRLIDCHQKLAEQCDYYLGTLLLHGTAGGTGSGLSSYAVEQLRDVYPNSYILTASVLPFESGDTPLQHYNTLLSLAWIQNFADGCLMLSNSDFQQRLVKQKQISMQIIPKQLQVGFGGLNREMKRVLLGMLAPIKAPSYVDKSGCFSSDFNGWNIISSVTPMTKFFSGVSADSLTDIQLQCNIGVELEYRQCIASQLYYRGGIMDGSFNAAKAQKSLANTLGFVRWNDYPMDIVIGKADGSLAKDRIFKSSAITETFPSTPEYTLLHNSASTTIPVLTRLLDGVERKMSVGAYLHWYERYFSGKGDFSAAVGEAQETLSGVLDKYFDLCS